MKVRVISRSAHEALFTCPRRYYLGYELEGTGLDSSYPDLKLLIGIAVHAGLEGAMRKACSMNTLPAAELLTLIDPVSCAHDARAEFLRQVHPHKHSLGEDTRLMTEIEECEHLVWALTYAWLKTELPGFLERFQVLAVEEEWRTGISPKVVLASRVDVFVLERATELRYVINWKTANKKDPSKIRKDFTHNSQMWLEAVAAEAKYGVPVQGTIVVSIYKGVERAGTHATPLLYAYQKGDVLKSGYTAGWAKLRADQLEGGIKGWIDSLPEEVIRDQFVTLDPFLKDKALVEEILEETVHHQEQTGYVLEGGSDRDKELHFPRRTGYWCEWCPFEPACMLRTTIQEMKADGLLRPRQDHHGEKPKEGAPE